ncbi:MAG: DNA-directed RNA polymerase subunit beta'', partial [Cyanobacteria bacterium NC_groundwater_1444_Ag_S-0.65um_54_12]|nr:DNA-directed RNA polymerase subunit beta'' [Cyanobacteria bacterium NC_groundwater_1444_Ag_S-0.65um_54_12]
FEVAKLIATGEKREWLEAELAKKRVLVTTIGRIIINEVLPGEFPFINKIIDKKGLERIIMRAFNMLGSTRAAQLANELKSLGFKYATRAGVSIAIEDLYVPKEKHAILDRAELEIEQARRDYLRGQITEVERYSKVIDTWSEATEELTGKIKETYDRLNSVYMMAFSGARGNISQVRQLVGMRGLMADPAGRIIDLPITSNFREGLNVTEYIISSYGARKGLVDTALRTADSGYLTRRLADVAQDVIVREEDCGTRLGLALTDIKDGESIIISLRERAVGRVLATDVVDASGQTLFKRGQLLQPVDTERLASAKIESIQIRSPLVCKSSRGLCRHCYGWSLTNNQLVDIGEAVGIIAAQSIGEPGTQLTMRTFHTGGVFTQASTTLVIKAKYNGKLSFTEDIPNREFRTKHGARVSVTEREGTIQLRHGNKSEPIVIPVGFDIKVKDGDQVVAGQTIAESFLEMRGAARKSLEKGFKEISSDISGMVAFEGFRSEEKEDRQHNVTRTAVPDKGKEGESIIWVVAGDVFTLPAGAKIRVRDGQEVAEEDVIAETTIQTELGGVLRLGSDIVSERQGDQSIILSGRDISVVTADLACNGFLTGTKEPKLRIDDLQTGEHYLFTLKVSPSQRSENDTVIAEHIKEEDFVASAGEIRYLEVTFVDKDKRTIAKPARLLFIPEERVSVNKDNSLLIEGIHNGMEVAAGTEVVKDIEVKTNGIIQIFEDNNIIREILVFPGDRYEVPAETPLNVMDSEEVKPGDWIAPGIAARAGGIVRVISLEEEEMNVVVVRRAIERIIHPATQGIPYTATTSEMSLQFMTRLQVRDGERVKAGMSLAKTEVFLKLSGRLSHLVGKIEIPEAPAHLTEGEEPQPLGFHITILESLALRRDVPTLAKRAGFREQRVMTYLMAEEGEYVAPGTTVVRTEILSHAGGIIEEPRLGAGTITRLLLVTPDQEKVYEIRSPSVRDGQYVREGHNLGEAKKAEWAGRVRLQNGRVYVRHARPYLISVGTQLLCTSGDMVLMGETLATLVYDRVKTGDIIQGLPRVEELLEARKPKDSALICERGGEVDLDTDPEEASTVWIKVHDEDRIPTGERDSYQVPPGSRLIVNKGDLLTAGAPLTDGPINPHDVLRISGVEATQRYLVDEVQMVYRSQGVEIADKHIEVIVCQMTRKKKVDDPGESTMLPGELVDTIDSDRIQNDMRSEDKSMPVVHPILLGITKASLNTESFVSAASFQETTRVLTEAAIEGKKDWLHGLKENVVIGRLIPAGTGFFDIEEPPLEPAAPESVIAGSMTPEAMI